MLTAEVELFAVVGEVEEVDGGVAEVAGEVAAREEVAVEGGVFIEAGGGEVGEPVER